MSAQSPTRSTLRLRGLALLLCATCGSLAGCVIVKPVVSNPTSNIVRVAVVPFVNHSAEPAVDPIRFSNAYFAELQKVPGFEVVPVSVTARAIDLLELPMSGPDDALALARELDVDAVVLGAVTDYDPYYPPRIGMHVEWYSPKPPDFRPGVPVDPFERPEWWRERIPHGPGPHLHAAPPVPPPFPTRGAFSGAVPKSRSTCPDGACTDFAPDGVTSQLPLSRRPRMVPVVVRGQDAEATTASPRRTPARLIRPLAGASVRRPWVELLDPPPDLAVASADYRVATFPNPFAPEATWDDDLNPNEDLTLAARATTRRSTAGGEVPREEVARPVPSAPPALLEELPQPSPTNSEPSDAPAAPRSADSFAPWPGPALEMRSDPVPWETPSSPLSSTNPYAPAPPPAAGSVADAPPVYRPPAPPVAFDPRQPIMSYTRIFDGRNADLLARLRDYYTLSGDRRSGGWEAYLHRSDDFIRFTAHVMIGEMLTLHGGETKRRYVVKLRKRH